jgi:hypothetical protein
VQGKACRSRAYIYGTVGDFKCDIGSELRSGRTPLEVGIGPHSGLIRIAAENAAIEPLLSELPCRQFLKTAAAAGTQKPEKRVGYSHIFHCGA